jgi:type VI secretion system protein ImpK
MTPALAQAVDPVLLHMLDLLNRVGAGGDPQPQEERIRIRAVLDQSEAVLGGGQEWDSAKYALISWIDEMLVDAPWAGRDFWSNNVLEMETFGSRACYERFYIRAKDAAAMNLRGALEVYYVCVILGFRGVYRDPDMSADIIRGLGLPPDVETWAKQVSLSLRLGQGRPALSPPPRDIHQAGPLRGRAGAVWAWLAAIVLGTVNLFAYVQSLWSS